MERTPDEMFGLEVKEHRENNGWSKTEFAARLSDAGLANFHPTTVGRMERGERPVRLNEAVVIANVLGSKLDDLVVEPLRGDEGLAQGMTGLVSQSKRAAWSVRSVEYFRQSLADEIANVEKKVAEGRILDDHRDEVESALSEARRMVAEDHMTPWIERLSSMGDDERRELYNSDRDFR